MRNNSQRTCGSGSERGIALVLTLFLTLATSIVAASMMFLSQTETYSSMNYRMMSQARYGAEAGVEKATNYLLFTYAAPTTGGADQFSNYVTTTSPVTYGGSPVILSANSSVASNYPVATVQTAFAAIAGSLPSGTSTVNYAPSATLISMDHISAAQAVDGIDHTIQTWLITSDGTITAGSRKAQVEVTATLDTQKIATNSPSLAYSTFATSAKCGAITFSGGAATQSYDSSAFNAANGSTITSSNGGLQASNGNVGTNGNLTESGGATINGSLSTPRVGVGNCSSGNVDADTSSGNATVTGGIVHLSQPVTLSTPNIVNPHPPTSNASLTSTSTCAALSLASPATCSGTTAGSGLTISPNGATINLGNLSLSGGAGLTIQGGTYNLNSLSVSGGGSVTATGGTIAMTVVNSVSLSGNSNLAIQSSATVQLNMVNTSSVNSPIDFSGGTVTNSSYNAALFQIQYGGTGSIKLSGGTKQAAVVYAPNAPVSFSGGSALYGEVVAATVTDSGGASVYYDRHLSNSGLFSTTLWMPGNPMMSGFSWTKF